MPVERPYKLPLDGKEANNETSQKVPHWLQGGFSGYGEGREEAKQTVDQAQDGVGMEQNMPLNPISPTKPWSPIWVFSILRQAGADPSRPIEASEIFIQSPANKGCNIMYTLLLENKYY